MPSDIIEKLDIAKAAINQRYFQRKNWQSISALQKSSASDPEAKGHLWVSRVEFPPPLDDDVRQALFNIVDYASDGVEAYAKPDSAPIQGEWVGHRNNVDDKTSESAMSEREKYQNIVREAYSTTTALYVHGGAFVYAKF